MTHLACPLDCRLGFLVITFSRNQTCPDPLRQKNRLQLAVRERVREITDNTKCELIQRFTIVVVRKYLLNELENHSRVRGQQLC